MVDGRSGSGGGGGGGSSASSAAAGAAITTGGAGGSRHRTISDDEKGGRMLHPRTQLALVTGAAIAAAVLLLRGPRPSLNERLKQAAVGKAESSRRGVEAAAGQVQEGVSPLPARQPHPAHFQLARQRAADEELRRQQDRFNRAFHRYQHASRTQHTFNWYWDGRSFGHGWDEQRAAVNLRRVLTAYEFLSSRGKQAARR
ncbi:unnamed protein product [Closterium sp. Naga37s-1]|nr:unnamed protein product [Closterium sp. Naga37s-1]